MAIRYSFDDKGGFYVFSEACRWAAYAYPTSKYAEMAKSNPGRVMAMMGADDVIENDLALASRMAAIRESMDSTLRQALKWAERGVA